jgi:uncharacterized protein YyaL (SSP411 family)
LAQSEDYALFVKTLLDLHQIGHRENNQFPSADFWLENALKVQAEFDQFLWSVELGGYYNTAIDANLLVRERSYTDSATPAANGIAIANLVRLSLLTENLQYLDRAEQGLKAFSSIMHRSPQACPSLFTALDWCRHSTLIRTTSDQLSTLINQYLPTAVCVESIDLPEGIVGMVCQGLSCKEPARSRERLEEQVKQSQARS